MGTVYLLLRKLEPDIRISNIVVTHPRYKYVLYVTVGSFNRPLTLWMSGFSMNHTGLWPLNVGSINALQN
ncbi:hypothetical protein DPMN_082656 [Dreissena polymorpha]|uniref:Uncharacterized protein n=1 Tax=Dreissena polymorpha TaxID=45954 RepID=A0A9D4BH07_DREPO|nr:hypothetical protein DPMN_082656 [Dreissena polymorpha]